MVYLSYFDKRSRDALKQKYTKIDGTNVKATRKFIK